MIENRWIISTHRYTEHRSIDLAKAEIDRLQKAHPKKKFRMYRIKSNIEARRAEGEAK